MKQFALIILLCCLTADTASGKDEYKVKKSIEVGLVPSDFPVNFALFTKGDMQFVAYYDTAHVMTVASRPLPDGKWEYQKLDTKVPWDSHNYIALCVDDEGYIHISGNMHSNPLKYFCSSSPMDIHTMQSLNRMVGTEEDVTTYPEFMRGPSGELVFHYRYGRSGNGYEVYNVWDATHRQWHRMTDQPIIDGEGERNAYMQGPVSGPDGYYHLIWVWRESPDCSSNHTLSYARSHDLIHWESIRGESVLSPITLKDSVLYVDNTPEKGGLINIGIKLGFDSRERPVIAYHKYDNAGNTQLFFTRYEDGAWKRSQLTNWDYRWNFNGWGTVVNELLIDAPYVSVPGELCYGYFRMDVGERQVMVDEETLKPLREEEYAKEYPDEIEKHKSDYSGLIVYKVKDSGIPPAGKEYILRWEALSPNRDQRRKGEVPEPMTLRVYEMERNHK